MPTEASVVGAVAYPREPGDPNTPLADPVVGELLRYFAHWLNYDLNAKLSTMGIGVSQAVPSGNVHPINPEAALARNPTPALYAWRSRDRVRQWSQLQWCKDDIVTIMWVFAERDTPHGILAVSGITNAAASTMARAIAFGRHQTFQPTGAPMGYPIRTALELEALGAEGDVQTGIMWRVPGNRTALQAGPRGGDGMVQSGYPSVMAQVRVVELVGPDQLTDDDLTQDAEVTLYNDGVPILEHYLTAPDGTEDP